MGKIRDKNGLGQYSILDFIDVVVSADAGFGSSMLQCAMSFRLGLDDVVEHDVRRRTRCSSEIPGKNDNKSNFGNLHFINLELVKR